MAGLIFGLQAFLISTKRILLGCLRRSTDMREMILNHASVEAFDSNSGEAAKCLCDIVGGMGQMIRCGAVSATLRVARSYHSVRCQPDHSLYDVWLGLRYQYPDEFKFFGGLLDKSKFLDPKRLTLYEERTLPEREGQPLIFAAVEDGVLIGFPSESRWDCDRIVVEFDELLPDGTVDERSEEVDQLTRLAHAGPVCIRHRSNIAEGASNDPRRLWENRQHIFPHLQFGSDVEQHLVSEANHLALIIKKLQSLDQSGKEWAETGGAAPLWKIRVTPESDRVMSNQTLRNKRYFQSWSGSPELFEWHARFGDGGRIHLRFDAGTRTIEIGYIGPHLPL